MARASREPAPTVKRAAVQASVLGATEELLAEGVPFAELGIERIAKRAGISRTAFYFYFKDKKELLERLTEAISEQLYEQADIWFSGQGSDPREEMHDALTRIGEVYREHGPLLRAIVEASTSDPSIAAFWRSLLGRFVEATAGRIDAEGPASAGAAPTRATAFALTWMTERSFYEHLVQDESFDAAELVDALTVIWVRSVYGTSEPTTTP